MTFLAALSALYSLIGGSLANYFGSSSSAAAYFGIYWREKCGVLISFKGDSPSSPTTGTSPTWDASVINYDLKKKILFLE